MFAQTVIITEIFTSTEYLGFGINYPTLTLINPYQSLKLLFIIIYGNTSSRSVP